MERFRALRAVEALTVALLWSGLPPAAAPLASVPESRLVGAADAVGSGAKPSLVEARALVERARAAYREGRDPEAVALVDESLGMLRVLMLRDRPITLRVAAGEIFRSAASLRLSATKRLDRQRDSRLTEGPAAPEAIDSPEAEIMERADEAAFAEDSPLAGAVLDPGLGATSVAEPVVLPGDPAFEAAAGEGASSLSWLAGGAFPDPEPLAEAPDPNEAKLAAEPVEPLASSGAVHNDDPAAIQLVDNGRVRKWVDYYTGRGRSHYERYLTRSGRYIDWMRRILREEGLPEDLVQLVFVESGFNTEAVSRSRAVGQWQFIRGTARIFDLRMNSHVDERKDPELATRAAARYLKHLYALFQDWNLAIASYNCGEGRTIRTVARAGVWDYWALRLRRETMHYVPKYMACLAISQDLERYGFSEIPRERPLAFDTIRLPGAFDVRAVATACGIPLDSLRALNPALKKTVTAPRNGVSQLRVPEGQGGPILAAFTGGELDLTRVAVAPTAELHQHRVRRGETLGGIARRYRVPLQEIAELNHIRVRSTLRIGQVLLIPERDVSLAERATRSSASHTYRSVKTIRIERGDTLSAIASRYDTDVSTLRALNNLRPRQHIRAGGTLKVPIR
jgi:membrane-bound lytic murein transglycosylase D